MSLIKKHPIWVCLLGVASALALAIVFWLWTFSPMDGEANSEKKAKQASMDNLRRIALAMHEYNATHGRLPPAVVYDRAGQPLYSWRVLLLPFLGEQDLYDKFRLDEPWHSPHNLALLSRRPEVYAFPLTDSQTDTHYMTFDGWFCAFSSSPEWGDLRPFDLVPVAARGRVFEAGKTSAIPDTFHDVSNSLLLVEATDAVPWTKPVDLPYALDEPLPSMGGLYSDDSLCFVMADAAVHLRSRKELGELSLRSAISSDGEVGLPKAAISILDESERTVLWSLAPILLEGGEKEETFHGWKVLGKTVLADKEARQKVLEALDAGTKDASGSAFCFDPRHAIRASSRGKTVDLVICFECWRIKVYLNGRATGHDVAISDASRPVFNQVLREAKIPLDQDVPRKQPTKR